MGRLETLRDWALGYDGYEGLLKLNALVTTSGDGGISADGSESVEATYIDGSEERTAYITIRAVVPWSEGSDSFNAEAATLMEGWADWLRALPAADYPTLDGGKVTDVTPTYTLPQLEGISETQRLAVYKLEIKFGIYLD